MNISTTYASIMKQVVKETSSTAASESVSGETTDEELEGLSGYQKIRKLIDESYQVSTDDLSEEEKEEIMQRIRAKLEAGVKLSPKELNFLRQNDPVMYAKVLRIEAKREEMKQKLKICRSKQEVEEVCDEAMISVRKNDPDKELIMAVIDKTVSDFKKTTQYASLPETKKDAKKAEKERIEAMFPEEQEYDQTI